VGWRIDDYEEAGGHSPVRDFIRGLEQADKAESAALIKLLQELGNQIRPPRSRALGQGLFELRGKQVRIFYVYLPGQRAVLLDGIVKKREDIPPDVLERVRRLQKETQGYEKKRKTETAHGVAGGRDRPRRRPRKR